ncbi:hypothetical protein PspLS_06228 [Pyricularia sp. CBS 133598]|nr:hypothetical protein PspLS_06228 [Pyricularia sp. CBS 133598]
MVSISFTLKVLAFRTIGPKQPPHTDENVTIEARQPQAFHDLVTRRPRGIQSKADHGLAACLSHLSKPLFQQTYYLDHTFLAGKCLGLEVWKYISLIRSSSSSLTWFQKPRAPVPIPDKPKIILPLRPPRASVVEVSDASQELADANNGGPSQYSENPIEFSFSSTTSSKNNHGNKRPRRGSDDDGAGQKGGGRRPQPAGGKGKTKEEPDHGLACPYYKRYHGEHCSPACFGPKGWPTIARLKEHLDRVHKIDEWRCTRCAEYFTTTADFKTHSRDQYCETLQKENWSYEKHDKFQSIDLRKRNRGDQRKLWESIWEIIFPDWDTASDGPIPSPYYDITPTEHFLEYSIVARSLDQGLLQGLFSIVSRNAVAVEQILELFAISDRANLSRWQGNTPTKLPSAVATSLNNSAHNAQRGLQLQVHPPPETPQRIPHLETELSSHSEYVSPNTAVSPANSYYSRSTTWQSQLSTVPNNNHLMPADCGTSVAEETLVGTSVSGGLDFGCHFDYGYDSAQPEGIPQLQGIDPLTGIGFTSFPSLMPGQHQMSDLAMGNVPTTPNFEPDELSAGNDGGTNFMPQNHNYQQPIQLVHGNSYDFLPWASSSLPREIVVDQVIDNADQQFPKTYTNEHNNGGTGLGNFQ